MSLEMFTFRGVEVPAFPQALAAHVPAPRGIVGTGVTGSAQQGCQSARARLAQSQGLTKADCCDGSPATAPFLLLLPGTMPAEEAFFLRLFPEQEFSWSRQGFSIFLLPFSGWQGLSCSCGRDAQSCALLLFLLAAGAVFALGDGSRSLVPHRRALPKPQLLVPALPCRRFELGTFCLDSRVCLL